MLAVGYEDDSFICYYFEVKNQGNQVDIFPIMRGIGHKNFVNCIKFDHYFLHSHAKNIRQQFEYEVGPAGFEENIQEQLPEDDVGVEGNTNLE